MISLMLSMIDSHTTLSYYQAQFLHAKNTLSLYISVAVNVKYVKIVSVHQPLSNFCLEQIIHECLRQYTVTAVFV
jgi:hypothetical protein